MILIICIPSMSIYILPFIWPKTIFVLKIESLHAGFCNPLDQSVVWRYVLIHLISDNFIKMKKWAKTTKTWAVDKCQKSKAGKTWPAQRWVVIFGRWAGLNFSHLPSEPVGTIPSRPIPDQIGTRQCILGRVEFKSGFFLHFFWQLILFYKGKIANISPKINKIDIAPKIAKFIFIFE